jgi:hypothetical protein
MWTSEPNAPRSKAISIILKIRFGVLKAVKIHIVFFRVKGPSGLLADYKRIRETPAFIFRAEYGNRMFHRNAVPPC